ncbi:MAG: glycosyltransferase family 2 protein [Vulcanococcus sp.]|uniref:glycosyltransferase family 2 protein n=1 Tax=Vulcanococcus sp. TaxID=2856995 RepID=UPI0025F8E279|nr:glycosyltransferase family 2 protein [Vulcanococcus sp.]MBW0167218.1 glycosyltransferase family 2 protein [Vulcanococcus sp.]
MKLRTLLRRLRTSAQVVLAHPGALARAPRFAWRALREGPQLSLARLRALSDPSRFTPNTYRSWLAQFHDPSDQEREAMRAWAEGLPDPPTIAVVMPVFNPNPEWLQEAIDSVCDQLYPHWQLCIADDCSTDPRVREVLEQAVAADQRIRVAFREQNGHISAASNTALELVEAPWVALLDHDDRLAEDALAWVARSIVEHPQLRMIFSDEDKIDANGSRRDPYFKCDWNPILMEGQNAVCHLGVYSTDLVREVGGFRVGYEGAQDHDLTLRCSRQLRRDQILHLPRILYHWRVHAGSTATGAEAKPYSCGAAQRVVADHLRSLNQPATAVDCTPVGLQPCFDLPVDPPLVSVIIPTRNGLAVLEPCLRSLLEHTHYPNLEVLVVDNGSDDPATLAFLAELEAAGSIRVLPDPSPFNYSALNNRAVEQATGEFICLMNNDIEVIQPDWLIQMLAYGQRPGVGAVGARLFYPDRSIQHGGVLLGIGGVAGHAHHGLAQDAFGYYCRAQLAQEMSAVTAACLLVRKSHYQAVGGLNAEDLRVAFNDVDFCLKLVEHGLHNVYAATAVLVHHESVSRGYEDTPEKQARFAAEVAWMKERWGERLVTDPAYNPNLSLDGAPFSLASPPRLQRWPSS